MNILAIDTSTKYFCLAIGKDGKMSLGVYKPLGKELSRFIIPEISKALNKSRLSLKDIDYFAAGLGPGSFTGLRIGLSTIKGFALSLNRPVVGVASLDTIAYAGLTAGGWICPIVDAKRSLVYSAIYMLHNGNLKRKGRYLLTEIGQLITRIKGEATFLGDGIALYRQTIERHLGKRANFLAQGFWYPRPENLFKMAIKKIENNDFVDSDRVVPLYLYPKECQIITNTGAKSAKRKAQSVKLKRKTQS